MNQIINTNSAANSHSFNYFPYAYGKFSTIKHWVETRNTIGQRLVHQTLNPYNNLWNKPKESIYYNLVFLFQEDNSGLIQPQELDSSYLTSDQIEQMLVTYHINHYQKEILENAYFAKTCKRPSPDLTKVLNLIKSTVVTTIPNITPIDYNPEGPALRSHLMTRLQPDNSNIESIRQAKRLKLHDKEALELPVDARNNYYFYLNKRNPDLFSDDYIDSL